MAATRKLQGEIERCLKKVTEGVETFEDIWQKVHNATNSNQKEKYEADLKKEIKKLQRLRDQIKSWIASGEIKDKSSLLDNRRLIETQMERFKVVERETKTKAYSKEGLGAAQKLDPAQREKESVCCWLQNSISSLQIQTDQYESEIESLLANKKKRLDKEKQDKMDDLKGKLDRHKFHITKLETLLRMLDNDSVDVEQIRKIRDDVEYYIDSSQEPDFEENEFIYDDIDGLDEVELSELPSLGTTESNNSNEGESPVSTASTSPINSPTLNCSAPTTTNAVSKHNHSSGSTSVDHTDTKKNKVSENSTSIKPVIKPTAVRPKVEINNGSSLNNNNNNNNTSAASAPSQISSASKPLISSTPSKIQPSAAQILANNTNNNSIQSPSTILPTAPIAFAVVAKQNPATLENGPMSMILSGQSSAPAPAPTLSNLSSVSNIHASGVHNNSNSNVMSNNNATIENHMNNNNTSSSISNCVSPTSNQSAAVSSSRTSPTSLMSPLQQQLQQQQQQLQQQQNILNGPTSQNQKQVPPSSQQLQQQASTVPSSNVVSHSSADPSNDPSMSTLKTIAQEVVNRNNVNMVQTPPIITHQNQQKQQQLQQQQSYVMDASSIDPSSTANINSLISASSSSGVGTGTGTNEALIPPLLGVAPLGPSPLQKDHQHQFQMMEAAYRHLPTPSDSERLRPYLQRNPIQTPPHYPQTQLPHSDTIDFFQRLATETLFFVFYYMEGTKAQYLAAKALKKQSWRFHTKYMMWFQRHEEPKIINEEYEQGTYIYFDYEKWGQRKKEGFTFEYKYLEDKDLN